MPLTKSSSKAAFKSNVKAELAAGKPRDQSLAIAYRIRRENRRKGGRVGYDDGGAVEDDMSISGPASAARRRQTQETGEPGLTRFTRGMGKLAQGLGSWVSFPMEYAQTRSAIDQGGVPEQFAGAADPMAAARGAIDNEARDWGAGTAAGMVGMGRVPGAAPPGAVVGSSGSKLVQPEGIRAYHGSPHDFDRFDISKIGTGEGAQVYGHGLYFAEAEGVARQYREALAGKAANPARNEELTRIARELRQYEVPGQYGKYNSPEGYALKERYNAIMDERAADKGHMYEVNVRGRPEDFLNYDAPIASQSPLIRDVFNSFGYAPKDKPPFMLNDAANQLAAREGSWETAAGGRNVSEKLRDAGVPGIRYLDEGSRGLLNADIRQTPKGDWQVSRKADGSSAYFPTRQEAERFAGGTSNYVVFNDSLIDILRKYGIAGATGPALGAVASQLDDPGKADGGSVSPALSIAYRLRRENRASGGRAPHTGPIMSSVPGRTDHHPMAVKHGAYVLPADHVSSLGQGNTAAGMAVLGQMFGHAGPYGMGKTPAIKRGSGAPKAPKVKAFADGGALDEMGEPEPVEIAAAGGEYVIDPETVAQIGGGDIDRGHELLDAWVLANRKNHISTLKKLPGPAKD